MSLLIKGMKMPKYENVMLRIDTKGEVYVYGTYPTKIFKAISIPDDGDPIDRNKLKRSEDPSLMMVERIE